MADYIGGYPAKVTIVGNSIYWRDGYYDEQIFSEYTTLHYVANVSKGTPESSQIVSNDGVQEDNSYKITVTDASGWSTGEMCSPIKQSTVYYYTTIGLAIASMSANDTLLVWFIDTNEHKIITASGYAPAFPFNVDGMARDLRLVTSRNTTMFTMIGDLSSQTGKVKIRNLSVGNCYALVNYKDTSNTANSVRITRCNITGCEIGAVFDLNASTPEYAQIDNCIIKNCNIGLFGAYAAAYFCTIVDCPTGISNSPIRPWIVQNSIIDSNSSYTASQTDIINSRAYGISENETANLLSFSSIDNLGFWANKTNFGFIEPRITKNSLLYHAGSGCSNVPDATKLYFDIDNKPRNIITPSIGASEGDYDCAFEEKSIMPSGFSAFNKNTTVGGEIYVTINNSGVYSENDSIIVVSSGYGEIAAFKAINGSGDIGGLENNTEYNLYAYSLERCKNKSYETSLVSVTPTKYELPTEYAITPSGLSAYDAYTYDGKTIYATISNGNEHSSDDIIVIYSSGGEPIGSFDAVIASGFVYDFDNNVEQAIYATSISSGKLESQPSNYAYFTPTQKPYVSSTTPEGLTLNNENSPVGGVISASISNALSYTSSDSIIVYESGGVAKTSFEASIGSGYIFGLNNNIQQAFYATAVESGKLESSPTSLVYITPTIDYSITPSGFSTYDKNSQFGGQIYVTIDNKTEYAANDLIVVYQSGGSPIATFSAYIGSGNIGGLDNDTQQSFYATSIEYNKYESNQTDLSYVIPTARSTGVAEESTMPIGYELFNADTINGGTLYATFTNSASYTSDDIIVVYQSGGTPISSFDASVGSGNICGLVDNVNYGLYLTAVENGKIESLATSLKYATPTKSTDITPPHRPEDVNLDSAPSAPCV